MLIDDRRELDPHVTGHDADARVQVMLAGRSIPVDHFDWDSLSARIETHLQERQGPCLTISSVNLDHLHHYGMVGPPHRLAKSTGEWLYVADGWPIAWRAGKASGQQWPRLAGSDILPEVMRLLDRRNGSLAVVGGTADMHGRLRSAAAEKYPNVQLAGMWSPDRAELLSETGNDSMQNRLAEADPDVVLVSLPKPLSEYWIARHAEAGDGRLYLPFGAAADFLSGHIKRAPKLMQRLGLEWFYRLLLEPRRMARRYLVQAPSTMLMLRNATVTKRR